MNNATYGATAGAQGNPRREGVDALLRLERALESAGAMNEYTARDIAALRLLLGSKDGTAAPLKTAVLKLLAGALYDETSDGGQCRPDLRGADHVLAGIIDGHQIGHLIDAGERQRIIAAVSKRTG